MNPEVSVILPVYNGERYVTDAVRRLLNQTHPSLEVVVVDDCSEDGTVAALSDLHDEERLQIVQLPVNGGVANARNVGLRRAQAPFVWFVDVDDEWSPDFIELMLKHLTASSADVAICGADYVFGPGLSLRERVVSYDASGTRSGVEALEAMLLGTGALWNKLFTRQVLGSDPFPPLRSKSDHGGIITVAPRVENVAIVRETLYHYVQRDGSISNGGVAQPQNFIALLPILDAALNGFPESPEVQRIRVRLRCDIVSRAIREVWKFDRQLPPTARELAQLVSWGDVVRTVAHDRRSALTCAAAKVSPSLGRAALRWLGRRRWTESGAR